MKNTEEEELEKAAEIITESEEWLTEATQLFGPNISWEDIQNIQNKNLRTWQGDLHYLGTALAHLKLLGASHNYVSDLLLPDIAEEKEENRWSISEEDREKLQTAIQLIDEVYENIEEDIADNMED